MLPVSEPFLNGREKQLLIQCIETGRVADGPFIRQFEEGFARYLGVEHGVAVCNGTAALETALYAVGLRPGDEIIMPSFTIISCALAALRFGATPVLVEIEPSTWNMDVYQIESKITSKTKAIMAVHMYGHPTDLDPVIDIAHRYGLSVIEDAAEAHGAKYKDRYCGAIGDIATFSFYANKVITTGEGGMVVTSNAELADRARSYRNLCFRPERRFIHTELGANYRMTNLQAAIGVAQLEHIEEFIDIKRRNGAYYVQRLQGLAGVKTQIEKPWARMMYWMYCIELDEATRLNADSMISGLRERDIEARPFFVGMHEQPVLTARGLFKGERYPITERASRQGLYLPSSLTLRQRDIDRVVDAVGDILKRR